MPAQKRTHPAQSLELIKPLLKSAQLKATQDGLAFTTADNPEPSIFPKGSETYINYFAHSQSMQETILREQSEGKTINFRLLKDILSRLYWNGHITNSEDFQNAIESSEGVPAYDNLIADPLVNIVIEKTTNPILFLIPILLSAMAVKLFLNDEVFSFYVLFLPQVFLTAKGLLSFAASTILFDNQEPMSLQFSIFGIYYKLSPGKRTCISAAQFFVHFIILATLAGLSLFCFHKSTDLIFKQFGPLMTALMVILNLSPIHNTDVSNLYFQISNTKSRRLGLKKNKDSSEKISQTLYVSAVAIYNFFCVGFCTYSGMMTIRFFMAKNISALIYQIVFDLAAVFVFFDMVDQFDKPLAGKTQTRHWTSKFTSSHQKFKTTKDMGVLIKAIPIFEGVPEEAFQQMSENSKILKLNAGAAICKEGDTSTDLFIVIEGQVGIYRRQADGRNLKIIDINEGSVFGEGSFLLNKPRSGSAYCPQETTLLVIKRPKAFASTDRTQEKSLTLFQKKIWALQALSQSEFFKDLPNEAAMQLINYGEILETPPQTAVITQGEISDSLWVIIQGDCQAFVDGKKVRDMKAKNVFGEIGIIWNSLRTSTVVTSSNTIFLKVQAEHVWKLLSQNINIAISLQTLGEARLKNAAPVSR